MGFAAVLSQAAIPGPMRKCVPWGITRGGRSKQHDMSPPSLTPHEMSCSGASFAEPPVAPAAAAPCPFQSLSLGLVELILSHLPTEDLIVSARAVCKEWRDLAEASAVSHVRTEWHLCNLKGQPRNLRSLLPMTNRLWRNYDVCKVCLQSFNAETFVIQRAVIFGDSIISLALAGNVTVDQLKRFNNLMTEASLHTREWIYVPATPTIGRTGEFHFCSVLNRQLVVLERHQGNPEVDTVTPALDPSATQSADTAAFSKLALLLSKGLRVDFATASFYLRSAGGDVRAAMSLHQEDNYWDRLRRRQ